MTEERYRQYCDALDMLEHASMYIDIQYNDDLPRERAKNHFDTRALLLNIRNAVLSEAEGELRGSSEAKP